jgi:hypothetical protein
MIDAGDEYAWETEEGQATFLPIWEYLTARHRPTAICSVAQIAGSGFDLTQCTPTERYQTAPHKSRDPLTLPQAHFPIYTVLATIKSP